MPDAYSVLLRRLQTAFDAIVPGSDPSCGRRTGPTSGQRALALSKQVGSFPQKVAADVVAAAILDDVCAVVEISGPGFINLTLSDEFLTDQIEVGSADDVWSHLNGGSAAGW